MRFKGGNLRELMKRVGSVLGLVVCLGATAAFADVNLAVNLASPLVEGDYQVGGLGLLRLSLTPSNGSKDRFKVKGVYVKGERCDFADTEVLLEGYVEGTVLVATLKTCMEGSGCASPSDVPLLGVVSEGTVTAYITVPRGCSAPGLEQRLVLQASPATLREVAIALTAMASKRKAEASQAGDRQKVEAEAAAYWARATPLWKRLTEFPEAEVNMSEALYQLGSAYNATRRYAEAKSVFKRTMASSVYEETSNEWKASILYNLACAEAGLVGREASAEADAIAHLKEAIRVGKPTKKGDTNYAAEAAADPELQPLHTNPEFQKLVGLKKGSR